LTINFAGEADNEALISLLKKFPLSAEVLSYRVDRSPDYFFLSRLQGIDQKIITVREGKQIKGTLSVIIDQVYLEQEVKKIAYTADLRVIPEHRGIGLADQLMREGIKVCKDYPEKELPVFTVVMKDNPTGLKKNQNLERDQVAKMTKIGELISYFIFPFAFRVKPAKKYQIYPAEAKDLAEMFALWQKINSKKQLARAFENVTDFEKWIKDTPDLDFNSYLLARDNEGRIKGFIGVWNQKKVRKIIVTKAKPAILIFRKIWNAFASLSGLPYFPGLEEELGMYHVLNLCLEHEDGEALPLLLANALTRVRENKCFFLALALDKNDPLNKFIKNFWSTKSELFLISDYLFNNPEAKRLYHPEISLG